MKNAVHSPGFAITIVGHILFLIGLFVMGFWRPPPEPKRPIMQLVALPQAHSPGETLDSVTPSGELRFPPIERPPPPRPVERPPDPPPPPPRPVERPRPQPPEPRPQPPPERENIDQFLRDHPLRQRQPAPQPPPQPIQAPRIDTRPITRALEQISITPVAQANAPTLSRQEQDALQAYFERIREAVRGAWRPPPGLHDHLIVSIRFDVSVDGRISNIIVDRSSGNPIYDNSVIDAFHRISGGVGPTPNRRADTLRLEVGLMD